MSSNPFAPSSTVGTHSIAQKSPGRALSKTHTSQYKQHRAYLHLLKSTSSTNKATVAIQDEARATPHKGWATRYCRFGIRRHRNFQAAVSAVHLWMTIVVRRPLIAADSHGTKALLTAVITQCARDCATHGLVSTIPSKNDFPSAVEGVWPAAYTLCQQSMI